MAEPAGVSLGDDDTIIVRGNLNVETVAGYRDDGVVLMKDLDKVVIDLSACEVTGSAGIALLIAWQREAVRAEKEITYRNASEKLLAIADACGVSEIVPFAS